MPAAHPAAADDAAPAHMHLLHTIFDAVAQRRRTSQVSQVFVKWRFLSKEEQDDCFWCSFPVSSGPPDQLRCSRFSRHAGHLEKKVEVIFAKSVFSNSARNLYHGIPCVAQLK